MISKKMQEALNGQVNAEMYSAYLYLSMESYFKSLNLNGFATWMRVQTQEEMMHAMKIYDFINERGGRVTLKPIEGPPAKWFVSEQVEEESTADEIVKQLKMMENAPGGMFMLDRELGQRVFTPPAPEGAP
jgi:ferritin